VLSSELLRTLPPGLTEWAVHPATADPDGERGRRADLDFLVSPSARELVS
jgi:hypothetical protein